MSNATIRDVDYWYGSQAVDEPGACTSAATLGVQREPGRRRRSRHVGTSAANAVDLSQSRRAECSLNPVPRARTCGETCAGRSSWMSRRVLNGLTQFVDVARQLAWNCDGGSGQRRATRRGHRQPAWRGLPAAQRALPAAGRASWIGLRLEGAGRQCNREALGSTVSVNVPGGRCSSVRSRPRMAFHPSMTPASISGSGAGWIRKSPFLSAGAAGMRSGTASRPTAIITCNFALDRSRMRPLYPACCHSHPRALTPSLRPRSGSAPPWTPPALSS